MLGGQGEEGQAVGQGGGLAGDPRVGQSRRDGRGDLQVPGHLGVVPGELAGIDPRAGQLAVQDAARLGARLPVHQPQPAPGRIPDTRDSVGQSRGQRQPFLPGAEPDHLAALGQHLRGRAGVVSAAQPAQVRPGHVHQPGGGQPQRLPARARPPAEQDRRVKQPERSPHKRQRRITARHDQDRPQRPDGPDHPVPSPVAASPGGQPARRAEPAPARRDAPQRQRDIPIAHRRQRDPGPLAAQLRDRRGRDRRRSLARPEQLFDRHAQRARQCEGGPQRRVGFARLPQGNSLPRHPGHIR